MHGVGWIVVALGLLAGGWMLFDGVRAFVVGDYVTASEGDYAGKLGPWSKVVERLGVDPRSPLVKSLFVLQGLAWIAVMIWFAMRPAEANTVAVVLAAAALWYLPFGSIAGLGQLAILGWLRTQG
jgi:hypothetical protein